MLVEVKQGVYVVVEQSCVCGRRGELGMIYVGKDEALGSLPCRRDA